MEENNNSPPLPRGWVWTTLGVIGNVAAGGTPSTNDPENFDGDVPWITPSDLSGFDGKFISRGRRNLSEKGLNSSSATLLPAGTVLFSSRAPIGYVAIAANPVSTNQGFKNLTCYEGVLEDYAFYYLKGSKKLAEIYGSGTTFKEVSASRFARIPIPLCPLPEQRRIVSRVEELFSCLDAGAESLLKVKTLLKRYRQAVLKYAFEGKLTEEWRKTHKNQTEPAQKLLEQTKQHRKKKADYKELQSVDGAELPKLPEDWVWTSIGQIYDIVGGGTPSTSVDKYWNGNIPWITSADIHGLKDIRPRKNVTKCGIENSATNMVPEGSLIVATRVGLGKIALTKTSMCFSQDCQALVGDRSSIFPEYSAYYLSKAVQVFKYRHRGTTIGGVPKKQLSELPFPLPSFDEQVKIVEEIEHHFSITDGVEKVVEQDLEQADRLRRSIFKTAFEGKLVPQDPSDEHADSLLARIREQKAEHENRVSSIVDQERKGLMHYVK